MSARPARACTPIISAPAACIRICRRDWSTDIGAWCDPFLKVLDDLQKLFTENRIFKQRNVDIGVVSLEEALALGLLRRDVARLRRAVGFAQGAAL